MLLHVQIDLSNADGALFEEYEAKVLALLGRHGARLEERLRTVDGLQEMHLLYFPDEGALQAFSADPSRVALAEMWTRCGAASRRAEVVRVC